MGGPAVKTCPGCGKGFVPRPCNVGKQIYCTGGKCKQKADVRRRAAENRESSRRYRTAHPDKVRMMNLCWRERHPDYHRDYARRYHQRHPEKKKSNDRLYYTRHRATVIEAVRVRHRQVNEEAHAARLLSLALQPTGELT